MVVTFLENSRTTLYLFATQEQVLGADNYKWVFQLHEWPVEHLKVIASSPFFCACCRTSECLASLAHIHLNHHDNQKCSLVSRIFPKCSLKGTATFVENQWDTGKWKMQFMIIFLCWSRPTPTPCQNHSCLEAETWGLGDMGPQQASQASVVHLQNRYCWKPVLTLTFSLML